MVSVRRMNPVRKTYIIKGQTSLKQLSSHNPSCACTNFGVKGVDLDPKLSEPHNCSKSACCDRYRQWIQKNMHSTNNEILEQSSCCDMILLTQTHAHTLYLGYFSTDTNAHNLDTYNFVAWKCRS